MTRFVRDKKQLEKDALQVLRQMKPHSPTWVAILRAYIKQLKTSGK